MSKTISEYRMARSSEVLEGIAADYQKQKHPARKAKSCGHETSINKPGTNFSLF